MVDRTTVIVCRDRDSIDKVFKLYSILPHTFLSKTPPVIEMGYHTIRFVFKKTAITEMRGYGIDNIVCINCKLSEDELKAFYYPIAARKGTIEEIELL